MVVRTFLTRGIGELRVRFSPKARRAQQVLFEMAGCHSNKVVLPCDLLTWTKVKEILLQLQKVNDIEAVWPLLRDIHNATRPKSATADVTATVYGGLRFFFDRFASRAEENSFATEVLPTVAKYAGRIHELRPETDLEYSQQQTPSSTILSRDFVASVVAAGFLCLFQEDEDKGDFKGRSRGGTVPGVNFTMLFAFIGQRDSQAEKLKCFFNYFRRLGQMEGGPTGDVVYTRVVLPQDDIFDMSRLLHSKLSLCPLELNTTGKIEDAGYKFMEIDFANQFLGGGVLLKGRAQEEIRFSICPELVAGMLFMECMEANEAIHLSGFEQFSRYNGYLDNMKFGGDFVEDNSFADGKGSKTVLSAIDAVPYKSVDTWTQYSERELLRELNKAYAGFQQGDLVETNVCRDFVDQTEREKSAMDTSEGKGDNTACEMAAPATFSTEASSSFSEAAAAAQSGQAPLRPIATGNWGCGAFGGDPQWKSFIQWLAATLAGCPFVRFYSFGEKAVSDLGQLAEIIRQERWTVGKVADVMKDYVGLQESSKGNKKNKPLFLEHIRSHLQSIN